MNHYGRSGNPGAKTQAKQLFSDLCLAVLNSSSVGSMLCVNKIWYVLHFLQMEGRNFLLKCFQALYHPGVDGLHQLAQRPEIWSSPISDVQGEGTNGSGYAPPPEGHTTVGPGGA